MLRVSRIPSFSRPIAGLGYTPRPIDPTLDLALTSVQLALEPSDPGVKETVTLIRDIVAAPGLFPSTGKKSKWAKLSDVNPTLGKLAFIRQNPLVSIVLLLAIPAAAFVAGRAMAKRT